ncbi:unnamed protein product [Protopolystoma xenopodis]|uniref:Uncharacterized protein n=1 Tax=Protopolystoma xenopodis TaxID=117903 RepID=A0A448XKE0_9PLAT|nr:unnamed protein product [Protopolystoma xenopodis]
MTVQFSPKILSSVDSKREWMKTDPIITCQRSWGTSNESDWWVRQQRRRRWRSRGSSDVPQMHKAQVATTQGTVGLSLAEALLEVGQAAGCIRLRGIQTPNGHQEISRRHIGHFIVSVGGAIWLSNLLEPSKQNPIC